MQYLLTALRDISPIPSDSEIVICHNGLRLKPGSRIATYLMSLPSMCALVVIRTPIHALNLHNSSQYEKPQTLERHQRTPSRCRGTQRETHDTWQAKGDMGMALLIRPSQTFVQDPEGKTHVLLFNPQDSIAKNLLRHSSQLHLLPPMDLYILSGSHIIQADRTGTENGLHREPHLKIFKLKIFKRDGARSENGLHREPH